MRYAFKALKLVVEPSGAAPLAALLAGKLDPAGEPVCLVLSGGSVDTCLFAEILRAAASGGIALLMCYGCPNGRDVTGRRLR
jgi:threonine dehydratase